MFSTGGTRYSRGFTFSKSPANTKTAENKGALYGQKVSFFKTKWAKILG